MNRTANANRSQQQKNVLSGLNLYFICMYILCVCMYITMYIIMQYLYYYVEQREMHKLIGMHKQTKHNWGGVCEEEDIYAWKRIIIGNNKAKYGKLTKYVCNVRYVQ